MRTDADPSTTAPVLANPRLAYCGAETRIDMPFSLFGPPWIRGQPTYGDRISMAARDHA